MTYPHGADNEIRYGSVCSGIEAATVAWNPLGWRPVFLAEIEPFCCALLKHHYSEVPNRGDFTAIGESEHIDVLVGGTPCQSFSVAGLRGGLADDRGNLALEFLRLAQRLRPRWIVWENVPGVLSSLSHEAPDPCEPPPPVDMECDGQEVETEDEYDSEELHAFNCFLAGLSDIGYGWDYRVLDAQYFGLAQRRKRVFVVGYLGDWRPPAAVLFDAPRMSWNSAPRREAGKGIAETLTRGAESSGKGGYAGRRREDDVNIVPALTGSGRGVERVGESGGQDPVIAMTLNAHGGCGRIDGESETFITAPLTGNPYGDHESRESLLVSGCLGHNGKAAGSATQQDAESGMLIPILEAGSRTGKSTCDPRAGIGIGSDGDPMFSLQAGKQHAIAFKCGQSANARTLGLQEEISPTLGSADSGTQRSPGVLNGMAVRRLTPRECERLQGFPDDYTLIPYHGKPTADGPRYRAIGNSMAVPVMRWTGRRIEKINRIIANKNNGWGEEGRA